jgi:hypothetical protein
MAIDAVDKDYLTTLFPEFSTEDSERIDAVAAIASEFVEEAVFGEKATRYARALLTAHMLKTGAMNGAGGAITGQSVGDISQTFAAPTITTGLQLTGYGQEFQRIARQKSASNRPLFV